jgi:hypothetical protein
MSGKRFDGKTRTRALVLLAAVLALGSYFALGNTLLGPQFLAYYLVLWAGLRCCRSALEAPLARFAPFVLFEGVGLWRYVEGSARGLHGFRYLFGMMLVGGLFFFVSGNRGQGQVPRRGSSSASSSSPAGTSFFGGACSSGGGGGCSSGGGGGCSGGGGCGGSAS